MVFVSNIVAEAYFTQIFCFLTTGAEDPAGPRRWYEVVYVWGVEGGVCYANRGLG